MRITYESGQVVYNFWSSEKDPVGGFDKAALLVPGVHCRLRNISPGGTWLQSESFELAGKRQ